MRTHRVIAFNTATASTNKIHDDAVARQFGFAGGLVPGVDVYAYITRPVAEAWGLGWLERGGLRARFAKPVYDGHPTTVTAREVSDNVVELEVVDDSGQTCATATAQRIAGGPEPQVDDYPAAPLPGERAAAEPAAVSGLGVLGSVAAGFHADLAATYLEEVRDDLPLYTEQRIAHPGWLLRFANRILAENVALGPWIHVESDVRHLSAVHDGDLVEARGRVAEAFSRKGHELVTLELVIVANGDRIAQAITHTAIYRPRPVSQA